MTINDTAIDDVAGRLRLAHRVAVLTGAGISAESGLPTFRGPGGFWRGHNAQLLATPEAFTRDPQLVWAFYDHHRKLVADAQPNAAHHAILALSQCVEGFTLVTQNVDRLHHRAGSADVIELHGNLVESRCTGCSDVTTQSVGVAGGLQSCSKCSSALRPNVVWFGEAIPRIAWDRAMRAAASADVLLVVGTSNLVYPAAGLASVTHSAGGCVVEINLEPTDLSSTADLGLYGRAGEILPALVESIGPRKTARRSA